MTPTVIFLSVVLAFFVIGGAFRRHMGKAPVRAWGFPSDWTPHMPQVEAYRRMPIDLKEATQKATFDKMNDLIISGFGSFENLPINIQVSVAAHAGVLGANLRVPPTQTIRYVAVGEPPVLAATDAETPDRWAAGWLLVGWDEKQKAAYHLREAKESLIAETFESLVPKAGPDRAADGRLYYAAWARGYWREQDTVKSRIAELCPELFLEEGAAEKFAAATEVFVRFPESLKSQKPQWFNALVQFYQFDPSLWGRA